MAELTFRGYARADGRVGTRNHVLILPLVPAANRVAATVAADIPEVTGIMMHQDLAPQIEGFELAVRTLRGWVDHPNVYATVLVGADPAEPILARVSEHLPPHVRFEVVTLAESRGTRGAIDRVRALVRPWLDEAGRMAREPVPVSGLILGTECGGSDACSGLSANPALGHASDLLIQAGGTSILAETTELIGAEHLLAERAVSAEVRRRLLATVTHAERASMRMGVDFRGAQPAPGNMEGGISTIEEKSLGCVHKGGLSPLAEVIDYGERPPGRGLVVMDTPGHDVMQLVGMAAGGAQVIVFTTGRGTPTGSAIVPVIKVSTRTALKESLPEVIDLDAGPVIDGLLSVEALGADLFRKILAVCEGERVSAERGGHREFGIFPGWGSEDVEAV